MLFKDYEVKTVYNIKIHAQMQRPVTIIKKINRVP